MMNDTSDRPHSMKSSSALEVSQSILLSAHEDYFRFLRGLPEFLQLPDKELRSLASTCRFSTVDRGKYIITEGDQEHDSGFIVVSGCIAMSKSSPSGRTLVVELLQSGDVFGLLLMLSRKPKLTQLSARAVQSSNVLWMPIAKFKEVLHSYTELLADHVTHLLRCLQSSYGLSRGLAHDRVEIRIASILCTLAVKFNGNVPAEAPYVIHFTRQELSELTGTTPETAIRITRAMQQDGLIAISNPGVIEVLNITELLKMAQDW